MAFSAESAPRRAQVPLPAWAAYTGGGPILLTFAPEGRGDAPLRAEERALAAWVLDHHAQQMPPLLAAVFAAYPGFRRQYFEDYALDESEEALPTLTTAADLPKVLTLDEVFVHQIAQAGAPYVGYRFACAWEDEHGLGVLMHQDRVVALGGAETAFLLWIAEEDRDRR